MSEAGDPRWLVPGRSLIYRYWAWTRGLTLGVRAAILRDGEVLLVRHGYISGWHLPGGGVERGESALDALRREVAEEAGVAIEGTPHLHGLFFNARMRARDHVAVYVVREFHRIETPRPGLEVRASGFFPLTALPDETTGPTRRRLAEIAGTAAVDATW